MPTKPIFCTRDEATEMFYQSDELFRHIYIFQLSVVKEGED